MFNTCYGLRKVIIPEGPTTIETQAFQNCYSLTYLIIPSTLTAINGANNFSSCYSMQYIVFKPSTPPTVAASTCLSGLPTTCLICVPLDKYVNYTQAQYYPSTASYTYIGWTAGNTYAAGTTLPTSYTGWIGTLTWYTSIDDLKANRNAITVSPGTLGTMIYCKNY